MTFRITCQTTLMAERCTCIWDLTPEFPVRLLPDPECRRVDHPASADPTPDTLEADPQP